MKKLNWDTIPSQRVLGKKNVWTSRKTERDLRLDIESIEELFSQVDKRTSIRRPPGLKNIDDVDTVKEPQVTILDSKRSMNIGIFLRHFKRPVTDIIQDICQGNWLRFGSGKLKELCKLLPEDTEVKQLMSFTGNMAQLPEADQFMVQLVRVPGYVERLKSMVLREEFFPLMEEVKHSLTVLSDAANELLDCDDLHSVIRLVLKAGNYMNAGGYSANAIGFRMTSLLNLADTKANKPGMNLMHYVAKQAEAIDRELLTFPVQLEHLRMASRMCKEEMVAEFEREVKKIKEVKLYVSRQPDLFEQMETFLIRADAKCADIERSLKQLNSVSSAVAEFFCEDPVTFKLQECCSIFHSFCTRFDTAVQENREREAAEEQRKRKESMRQSTKRRPTASCPQTNPNGEQDPSGLEDALHSFLSSVPGSISRSRRNLHLGSSPSSQSVKVESSPQTSHDRPDKKQAKLNNERGTESKKDEEKIRESKRKVLRHQNSRSSLDGDRGSGTPRRSDRSNRHPSTPKTPRNKDYFYGNGGSVDSPWTILSPVTCTHRNSPDQKKLSQKRPSIIDDPDDGIWESVEVTYFPDSTLEESLTASISCTPVNLKSISHGPLHRSVSVDESRRSPASAFWIGDFFQRSFSQRSYSSGSRRDVVKDDSVRVCKTSNPFENQGIKSFFKRIGNRNKPGEADEPTILKSCT
ncbi:FH2 domain containing 3 [Boleophthalmus pectinirostris]|uniref:FH2 domain containing 3 n=1 Tax=Boleophthalmus pectinirostris TaxID=150288 RepID=UPI000A1C5E01|nr:FH2 domain containing 3 [Boleophthalmus pectinirostris]